MITSCKMFKRSDLDAKAGLLWMWLSAGVQSCTLLFFLAGCCLPFKEADCAFCYYRRLMHRARVAEVDQTGKMHRAGVAEVNQTGEKSFAYL